MNRQAAEAGRLADELHQQMIAEMNGNTGQASAPASSTPPQAPEYPGAGTQEHPDETWKQKYQVIEGKYRTEVPLLHQRIRILEGVIADKDRLMVDLNQKLEQAKAAPIAAAPVVQQTATDFSMIEEDHGVELANTLRGMQSQMEALRAENEKLKAAGAQQQAAPAQPEPEKQPVDPLAKQRMDFMVELIGGPAEFKRIDNDPQFSVWLDGQEHPLHPETRRENLQGLFHRGMLNEAAAYFISWRDQSVQGGAKPTEALMEQLQPGVTLGGSNVQDGQQGKIWTISEIRGLQKQIAVSPKYKTPEGRKEAEALEAEFLAANQQGRIINR